MSFNENTMHFVEFQNKLQIYPLFSLQDVRKIFSKFSYRQLDRWEKNGYLKKVKRGFYCFSTEQISQSFLYFTANKIYAPSYISLEIALKHYGLIPEEIFQITSVATKKTTRFETPIGNFSYKQIKPSLYWGYKLVDFGTQRILFAEPEKAILDYLYIHPRLKTAADFEGMRINVDEFRLQINTEKFKRYLQNFDSKQLAKRAHIFLATIHNDNS